jgi:hypothetical protein
MTIKVIGCKRISSQTEFSLKFDLSKKSFVTLESVNSNSYVACVLDQKWVPAFVVKVEQHEKEIEAVILLPISVQKLLTLSIKNQMLH